MNEYAVVKVQAKEEHSKECLSPIVLKPQGCQLRTPLKKCSLTADDGASPPPEWCTHSAEMVHGGRGRGAAGRHA